MDVDDFCFSFTNDSVRETETTAKKKKKKKKKILIKKLKERNGNCG